MQRAGQIRSASRDNYPESHRHCKANHFVKLFVFEVLVFAKEFIFVHWYPSLPHSASYSPHSPQDYSLPRYTPAQYVHFSISFAAFKVRIKRRPYCLVRKPSALAVGGIEGIGLR
jgi:hypothetical protein